MAGDVFWSARANRFYQEGRQGAVSNDTGIRNLIRDEGTSQYIDSRGRTVPDSVINRQSFRARDLIAYDGEGRPFVSATVRSRVISELEAKARPMGGNQDVMLRTVVTTPDGTTHVFYYPGKLGQNVDPEKLREQAAKEARARLMDGRNSTGQKYSITTNEIRNKTTGSSFILRTTSFR